MKPEAVSAFLDLPRGIHDGDCDIELLACQPIGRLVVVTYDAKPDGIVRGDVLAGARELLE